VTMAGSTACVKILGARSNPAEAEDEQQYVNHPLIVHKQDGQ